jgi:hypothetical protein
MRLNALINILVFGNGINECSVHRRIAPDGRFLLLDNSVSWNVTVCGRRQCYAVDNSDNQSYSGLSDSEP